MAGYAHINYDRSRSRRWFSDVFLLRRARAKLDLFSIRMISVMIMVCIIGALLILDSFLKSYEKMQLIEIRRRIDRNRATQFIRNEVEGEYLKMVSDRSLMEQAEKRELRVVTREQVLRLR